METGGARNPRPRTIVYVDGFNLYYGAVRYTAHKWLNLERYFTLLRQEDDVLRINYFTALICGPRSSNQSAYLRALETLPKVWIILGKFKEKRVRCHVRDCTYLGRRKFVSWEEKRTDVNLALEILDDAYQDRCDNFVIVSGDSDLVPAVHKVKSLFPDKKVFVYVPSRDPVRGAAVELRSAADKDRTLPQSLLRRAQFSATIPDGSGGSIVKPGEW